jgi:hypothetical protein
MLFSARTSPEDVQAALTTARQAIERSLEAMQINDPQMIVTLRAKGIAPLTTIASLCERNVKANPRLSRHQFLNDAAGKLYAEIGTGDTRVDALTSAALVAFCVKLNLAPSMAAG